VRECVCVIPEFIIIGTPECQPLLSLFDEHSHPARINLLCQHNLGGQKSIRADALMGRPRGIGSLKLYVSSAKKPYKKDCILQKRPIILRSLLIVATTYPWALKRHLWHFSKISQRPYTWLARNAFIIRTHTQILSLQSACTRSSRRYLCYKRIQWGILIQ